MPWQEVSAVSLRAEFVALANQDRANVRALCRQFQISPPTAYKWLARFARDGPAGLVDRSRRPHHSPTRTSAEVEANVIALRDAHPTWGGRKVSARLEHRGQVAPQPSTVTEILRRHGRLESAERVPHSRYWTSQRIYPEVLPAIEYSSDDQVRRVQKQGDSAFSVAISRSGCRFVASWWPYAPPTSTVCTRWSTSASGCGRSTSGSHR
jgi:transposase